MNESALFLPHGGFRKLRSFQTARLVYDATVLFCNRFIDKRSRTHDQMVQAARSGVQNIAEGSLATDGAGNAIQIRQQIETIEDSLTRVSAQLHEPAIRIFEGIYRHSEILFHLDREAYFDALQDYFIEKESGTTEDMAE